MRKKTFRAVKIPCEEKLRGARIRIDVLEGQVKVLSDKLAECRAEKKNGK